MRFYMLLAVALLLTSVMSTDDVSIHQTGATRQEKKDDDSPCPPAHPHYCHSLKVLTCCKTECDLGNRCNSYDYRIWE
uniref:Conotoxin-like unassigned superfamily 01 n=1 Tax=Conus ermineus TaxID=55423 RepID=A0A346CJ59_CONER|nr:conotoxin-like precursor unassigned superfamily 01 [Conus ermineus]